MQRNFLPAYVGISMTKSQLCFCTGITPYRLRQLLNRTPQKWSALGYHSRDKLLMPAVIGEILSVTGLQIDVDLYTQYVAGQRGMKSDTISR